MHIPTDAERAAFVWMQGRMVELLLRHHPPHFERAFAEWQADPTQLDDPYLLRIRELAVLFYLRDELFGSILPRIKRRLSFAAPRETQREELPPRGRIDWPRTAAASWRERPGEPPLEVITRQRRRHFATPENLLVVVTLLEYRHAAQGWLDDEAAQAGATAVRHPLHEIVELCTRELAFPQFAGLVQEAKAIASGQDRTTTPEVLEEAVDASLIPGRNSAYDDLLRWRRRLRALRLLDRIATQPPQAMLGTDPKRDNYLYQLWLFYELGDFLSKQGRLEQWNYVGQELVFAWGEGEAARRYRLQHDQATLKPEEKVWQAPWQGAGARPDFYLAHAEPREVRTPLGALVWREPGVVLDAKYYRPKSEDEDEKAPSGPLKRMLADLLLTGESYGALLFGFHGAALTSTQEAHVYPLPLRAQTSPPDLRIDLWRIQPEPTDSTVLEDHLTALLERLHQQLRTRPEVRCHGFFLDTLSATAHKEIASEVGLLARMGGPLEGPPDELLVCPKPHVAPWRVDLVHHSQCCADPSVCHIIGQAGVVPPQRLVRLEQIHEAIRAAGAEGESDEIIGAATKQVLVIARRYADLIQPDIQEYRRDIKLKLDIGELFETTSLLDETQRETLALGLFLWKQIDHIRARNYAGPALLFTGVLEEVMRSTVFKVLGPLPDRKNPTMGTPFHHKKARGEIWNRMVDVVVRAGHWQEQVADAQTFPFTTWVDMLEQIRVIRNEAAHEASVPPDKFQLLCSLYFGGTRAGVGAMNGVLLAWQQ